MRAGDRHRRVEPHQLGQHLGAAGGGRPLGARGFVELRVVGLTAVEMTIWRAPTRLTPSWPMNTRMPLARRRRALALSFWSLPCTL